ncbi:DUF1543 domain-containing protein [Cyanobium sp. Morenito 9A2]|uniref:DUF1543 domain-containing protein n=1 Tax=Cyanobium sp. Morenito 9A2 TaxID=2823718 RepID=UPI0020CFBF2A|nr:DUF1543 domain-containing protein [Cyanobium sp. Morenito 9A2]MCP9851151.1 DUF1543 domain-containing protein [Cyanobium sp. Morenito 9A2]
MRRLHLVVLGGRSEGCHIELHDVRFMAVTSIDEAIPELRRQWLGRLRGLHIDSYVAIDFVDGHAVALSPEPWEGTERLWFVNMGAYDPSQLAELHQFTLVVAPSAQAAKARARRRLLPGAIERHTDDLHDMEEALQLGALKGWHVHLPLDPEGRHQPLVPDWFGYRRIDRQKKD